MTVALSDTLLLASMLRPMVTVLMDVPKQAAA